MFVRWGFIFPGVSLHPAVSHSPVLCGGRRSSFPPNVFNHLSSNCLIAVNVNSTFSASPSVCMCAAPSSSASQGPSGSALSQRRASVRRQRVLAVASSSRDYCSSHHSGGIFTRLSPSRHNHIRVCSTRVRIHLKNHKKYKLLCTAYNSYFAYFEYFRNLINLYKK